MIPGDVLRAVAPKVGDLEAGSVRPVGGGSINRSFEFGARDGSRYFVKLNTADMLVMFEAERDGLAEIAAAGQVRVPATIACGTAGDHAYLLMESLDLRAPGDAAARLLGTQLAGQHRVMREKFGWHRDNTIGSTPQMNAPTACWIDFLRDARLGYQLQLAAENGLASRIASRGDELLQRLEEFFAGYSPGASLLHGDLWGGNWAATADGAPVIFDPAVYFGDREADIAMTMLFGGFGPGFMESYDLAWPLDSGFRRRADLYNLYHVLNHFNLFGSGYQRQVDALLDRLLT
ncbi:MAG: fructosamine kinase family protein [Gammaproteobacteria bacterium]